MDSITEGFESQDIESTLRTPKHDSVAVTPKNKSSASGSHRIEQKQDEETNEEPKARPAFMKMQTYGEVKKKNIKSFSDA